MNVLANLIVIIIPQYIHVLNHHIVHLRLRQSYMSIKYQYSWGKLQNRKCICTYSHIHGNKRQRKYINILRFFSELQNF